MEDNYTRYLAMRGVLEVDTGIRSERDNRTALSAFYRRHDQLTGFKGGHCTACGKLQFPMTKICVHCHAADTQVEKPMSGLQGTINSYTEDWLAFSPRPPLIFGNIHFPGQANLIMEFTDFLPDEAGPHVSLGEEWADCGTAQFDALRKLVCRALNSRKAVALVCDDSGGIQHDSELSDYNAFIINAEVMVRSKDWPIRRITKYRFIFFSFSGLKFVILIQVEDESLGVFFVFA